MSVRIHLLFWRKQGMGMGGIRKVEERARSQRQGRQRGKSFIYRVEPPFSHLSIFQWILPCRLQEKDIIFREVEECHEKETKIENSMFAGHCRGVEVWPLPRFFPTFVTAPLHF